MSTKIIAIVLVAVIAVAGIGAVALMGGGDEPSTPIPGGEDAAVGYDATLDASKFGAEIESVKGPEGLKVTIEGTGDSQKVVIEGIPKGETSIEVTYVDGKVSVFILKGSDEGVRLVGEKHDGSSVDDEIDSRKTYVPAKSSNWSYWTGNVYSPASRMR